MLTKDDFWPPIQGGWQPLSGIFVSVSDLVSAFELPSSHPDLLEAEDGSDVASFLDDMLQDRGVPAPEVMWFNADRVRDASGALRGATGYYAYWPEAVWKGAPVLAERLKGYQVVGPISIHYRYSRFVAVGADVIFFLLFLLGLLCLRYC